MGKIVKYCGSCEEGFAEKFTFCPDCGSQLQTFEMKPVASQGGESGKSTEELPTPDAVTLPLDALPAESLFVEEPGQASEPVMSDSPTVEFVPNVDDRMEEMFAEESAGEADSGAIETEFFADGAAGEEDLPQSPEVPANAVEAEPVSNEDSYPAFTGGYFYQNEAVYADEPRESGPTPTYSRPDDDGFYVTVIQETNSKQRNMLLLGSAVFMLTLTLVSTIYSLFNKSLGVYAIDDGTLFSAVIVDEIPMTLEEEKQQADKDDGGGGGGGGRDEKEPTSKGQLASQTEKPIINPTKTIVQRDFELQQPIATTQGNRQMPRDDQPYGDPNAKFGGLSDGTGSGGGQGSGFGQGQGSGTGTGMGSGSGSGSGSGFGDGNGGGTGSGGGPPPVVARVTSALRIIDKPRAQYNDEGRKNNVQGSVKLRVTLLASGQVGSITPVTRLPYGLTEQAIAAARRIRFEPKKVNGVAINTVVTMEYAFTIY